jgi:uncharacterized protein (UPF0262 family)
LIVDIRIHDALWSTAADERRREWRLLIADFIDHRPEDAASEARLRISTGEPHGTVLLLETLDGAEGERIILPADRLAPLFGAYLDVCRRMAMLEEGSHSSRLEALDMGKRVTHDRAASTILELAKSIIPDHATGRRLFSLLMSLEVDTTRLHIKH